MNEILPIGEKIPAEISALPTAELRAELAKSLQLSAEQLLRLALIWRELEQRGEDLSALRAGMGSYLAHIAAGRLHADAVVQFAGNTTLLRALTELPMPVQKQLVSSRTIPVLEIREDGSEHLVDAPAHALSVAQIRQAIGGGRLRDAAAQRAILVERITLRRVAPPPAHKSVRFDPINQQIIVGRTRIELSALLRALADVDPLADASADPKKLAGIHLTESEHRAVRVAAAASDTTISDLVRGALRALRII